MSHLQLSKVVPKLVRLLQAPGCEAACKPTQFLRNHVQQYTMLEDAGAIHRAARNCQAYSVLLESVREHQELEEKYGKGESSVRASAHRVGLELPKTYDEQQDENATKR